MNDTNQLSKAADAAWCAYEKACITWSETLVAAVDSKHSTDLGDDLTLSSRLLCATNIPSGIRDEMVRLRSGLTGEDAEQFRLRMAAMQGEAAALKLKNDPKAFAQTDEEYRARVGRTETADVIAKEHRVWLWPKYLGRNRVAHFGGGSTEGKSPVTLDLAARVSAGLPWPDGTKNELGPQSVIILAAEDDWADTVRPRLELAGADLENIHRFYVEQQNVELTPSLDADCQRLEEQIEDIGNVALVVIDPITNYLGSKQMNVEERDTRRYLDAAVSCGQAT